MVFVRSVSSASRHDRRPGGMKPKRGLVRPRPAAETFGLLRRTRFYISFDVERFRPRPESVVASVTPLIESQRCDFTERLAGRRIEKIHELLSHDPIGHGEVCGETGRAALDDQGNAFRPGAGLDNSGSTRIRLKLVVPCIGDRPA
mgnify:CR=1 FL=1